MNQERSYRMLVFDLDGTLCPLGKGLLQEDIARLKKLEASGYRITICSGKTTFYLCGLFRQLELDQPILIGENGAVIQFGIELPPKEYYVYPYSDEAKKQIRYWRDRFDEDCSRDSIWYQPNDVALTPFPQDAETFEVIQSMLDEKPEQRTALEVYRHIDCFDLSPKEISKSNGLKYLSEITGISADQMIAVGNGVNDVPMFETAGLSVMVHDHIDYETDIRFETIGEALDYFMTLPH